MAKENIIIDSTDELAEILSVNVNIINQENKISYNKILVKSDLEVKIMYLTEENRINTVESKIPIMGFVDAENVNDNNTTDIRLKIKNIIVKPNSQDEHSINTEAEIEILCYIYEKKKFNMIEDIYSPTKDLIFNKNEVCITNIQNVIKDRIDILEKVNLSETNEYKIINIFSNINITNKQVKQTKLTYEGELNLRIIYQRNNYNDLESKKVTIPFSNTVEVGEELKEASIKMNSKIINDNCITERDGSLSINATILTDISILYKNCLSIIDDIQETESLNENNYSMTIYFVKSGDTLWNIAKRFKSIVEDIVKINEIENPDKIIIGQQLYIPKYISGGRKSKIRCLKIKFILEKE